MKARLFLYALWTLFGALGVAPSPATAGQFDSWVALIVAGDFHAHTGAESSVFDNGRRDLAKALQSVGFTQSHILQFSVQPEKDMETRPKLSDVDTIRTEFTKLARLSSGGCFLYFTSHGGPQGILVNNAIMSPQEMAKLVNDACADRATVAVVSACYSGVFVPFLRSDTRMVMTAARADRTSFGCGEASTYTFFDQCMIESIPLAPDFPRLGFKVQDCVAAREKAEGMNPPSEPQLNIGNAMQRLLPQYAFTGR
jgi:hypothetical protein